MKKRTGWCVLPASFPSRTVFDDMHKSLLWLRFPDERIGGRTPLSLLQTESGGRVVENMLWQLDEGIYTSSRGGALADMTTSKEREERRLMDAGIVRQEPSGSFISQNIPRWR